MGHKASISYKPNGIGINKNEENYPHELNEYVKKELEEFNYFFGYTNHPEKENPIKIFDYKEHSEKSLRMYEGFKIVNEETLEWCVKKPE